MSAQLLRAMLSHALLDAGPDGPTFCEGWRTRHLAAHLVLREHETWRMAGLLIPSQRPKLEELTIQTGDAAIDDYEHLVARFAAGPEAYSPWRLVDNPANILEYAVHLEDVVRAGDAPATEYPDTLTQEIWRHFTGRAPMMFHASACRIALIADEGDGQYRLAIHARAKSAPLVVVRGSVIDLVLLAFGRPADVKASGPDDAVTDLLSAQRGF